MVTHLNRNLHNVIFLFGFLISFTCWSQDLVINEAMSSNDKTIDDEDGNSSDWIEIYNNSNAPIQLHNYFLSDDEDNALKWQFPMSVIGTNDFILVYCSGKDRKGLELHTNFKLKAEGEEVYLSLADKTEINRLDIRGIKTDQSIGSETDGSLKIKTFDSPTPGYSNLISLAPKGVLFSKPGGIYPVTFDLILEGDDSSTIYYTTDGNVPTAQDEKYVNSLKLDETFFSDSKISDIKMSPDDVHHNPVNKVSQCIVIRAATFYQDKRVSDVKTETYFFTDIGVDHDDLPLVSIVADTNKLFNYKTGLFVPGVHFDHNNPNITGNYFQSGDDWERTVNIEYYHPSNSESINQQCGLRIHGSGSRKPPQKAMRLYARSEYGESKFRARLFSEKPFMSTKRLILKPFYSSWSQSGSTDFVAGRMAKNLDLDYLAADPCVLYINGVYWGIYFLQERIDEKYIAQNTGLLGDNIDVIESWGGQINEGSNKNFNELYAFIRDNSLANTNNYQKVSTWIDIDNFIDYQIFQAFISNYDWPANNMKCWRERREGAKWRWVFFDADGGLENITFNGLAHSLDSTSEGWPTNPESTIFLRKLMQNTNFRNRYTFRLRELLNGSLHNSKTVSIASQLQELLKPEIDRQSNRFNKPTSMAVWNDKMMHLDHFLTERPCRVAGHALDYFNEGFLIGDCIGLDKANDYPLIIPNPSKGTSYIVFQSERDENGCLEVFNTKGQKVLYQSVNINPNTNYIEFDIQGNMPGLYLVRVNGENLRVYSRVLLLSN